MVRTAPWTLEGGSRTVPPRVRRTRAHAVFFPGIREDELNRPTGCRARRGNPRDWLHYAPCLFSPSDLGRFVRRVALRHPPPTDDRPFFENFGKLGSIIALQKIYGELWPTRDRARICSLSWRVAHHSRGGRVLTIVPSDFRPEIRRASGVEPRIVLRAIGLGYMTAEICVLSRLTAQSWTTPFLRALATVAFSFSFRGPGRFAAAADRYRAPPRLVRGLLAAGRRGVRALWNLSAGLPTPWDRSRFIENPLRDSAHRARPRFSWGFDAARAPPPGNAEPVARPVGVGVNGFASVLAPPGCDLLTHRALERISPRRRGGDRLLRRRVHPVPHLPATNR